MGCLLSLLFVSYVHTRIPTPELCFEPERQRWQMKDCKIPLRISGDTGGAVALEWAKKHLEACRNSHGTECRQTRPVQLPRRLLDLSKIDCLDPQSKVRIRTTRPMLLEYICLSYCWGPKDHHPPKLLQSNMTEYASSGITFASLPLTFQEAILLTIKLGFQHLWIDSLCIVQDDIREMQEQIEQMDDIFEGSELTLAISRSDNPHKGCFAQPTSEYQGFHITQGKWDDELGNIFIRRALPHIDIFNYVLLRDIVAPFPLFSRAWAFQESFLPRRIIYFGPQELSWNCRSHTCCECGMTPYKDSFKNRQTRGQNWHMWRKLLTSYVSCNLTYESDRLPAILGVAKRFENYLHDSFTAGVWSGLLPGTLSWSISNPAQNQNSSWPTWSWLSISGTDGLQMYHKVFLTDENVSFKTPCTFKIRTSVLGLAQHLGTSYELEISGPIILGIWNLPSQYSKMIEIKFPWSRTSLPWSKSYVDSMTFDLDSEQSRHHIGDEVFGAILHTDENDVTFSCYMLVLSAVSPTKQLYRRIGCLGVPVSLDVNWSYHISQARQRKITVI